MSLRLVFKPIPETRTPGVPDPRVLQTWLDARANPRPPAVTLADQRAAMGWPNLDLSSGVTTVEGALPGRSGPIPVRTYRPSGEGPKGASAPGVTVVYFHGGGFFGGTLAAVENPCKRLAQRSGLPVVSVDYRLAPEAPFPAGLDDCWDAVVAVDGPVVVAGDSAGGNLAAACSLLSAREGKGRVVGQMLVYPVVDLRLADAGHQPWTWDDYQINAHHDLVRASVSGLKDAGPFLNATYLQGQDAAEPLVSPLNHGSPGQFPPTLVATAEFDFLRVEGEAFAQRLSDAGVAVRALRYLGMDHAFLDKLGLFPQAADLVDEMADFAASLAAPLPSDVDRRLAAQLDFLAEVDKLKLVVRQNRVADASRRENTAEHSWHLVLFALTLAEHSPPGTNVARAVELVALHDLVEIDAGDTFFLDAKGYEDKEAREKAAAERIFGLLPPDQARHFRAAWDEFEDDQTPEARFANAVDRMAPGLLNSRSGGHSWAEHGVTLSKILTRNAGIAQTSPALGRAYQALLQSSVEKGFLKP